MQIPLVANIRELSRAPRQFLLFTGTNLISWQCIIGAALVLFARKIDMPPSWVGVLLSFIPLTSMLVVVTVPLVAHYGSKRVMFTAWTLRNVLVSFVFVMPYAIRTWGPRAAWYVLLIAVLGFCFSRAIGAGGWLPWLHELVPPEERTTYFGAEAGVTHLVNVGVIIVQALMLRGDPGIDRYLLIYGLGIAAGLISMAWLSRVPGGCGSGSVTFRDTFGFYRNALKDGPFIRFVFLASICFCCMTWLGSAMVMFMRDMLSLSSRTIMLLMGAGSMGILLTIRFWGRYAEHSGSGRAMFKSLTGHSFAALACLAFMPGDRWTLYALAPTLVLSSIFVAAFWTTAHRAMLNRVVPEHRIGYTCMWTLCTAGTLGITPIIVGYVIEYWGLWGFRICFLLSGIGGLTAAIACKHLVGRVEPADISLLQALNPALPIRTIARIMWITAGMHESNHPSEPATSD